MLIYKGQYYACGCGLDTSLADCSVRRVHKIDRYMVVCMRVDFMYFTYLLRLTLINLNLLNLSKLSIHIVAFLKQIALNILLSRSYATVVI